MNASGRLDLFKCPNIFMWLIYLPDNNISIKEPTKFSEEADIKNILMTNSQTSSTSGASYSRDRAIYSCLLTRTNFLPERIASLFPSLTICIFFYIYLAAPPTYFVIFVERDRCRRIRPVARENRGVLCSHLKRGSHTRVKSFKYWPMPVTPLDTRVSGKPRYESLE